ncbi:MAG: FHA domain-containing protein [Gammaproteobacteria bacterium]|nr:FHA domain-containing protein [Gammaproteobacteria bacterium]NIR97624.1 FHA domain-containing protein [Gammaproteobacteria bacterium]NIT63274.1 FHA domain-containing protein [Gammaproteobacteria bacterium]NIV20206.1 FHA domain-containing protein [Gammaproteobacteria bacterium]NIY31854.1 FHA domain-containing protein [Gammaproteobacteria bacterium]
MAKIIISRDGAQLDEFALRPGTINIGRGGDNDVVVGDSYVSTRHAKIITYFNASYVQDLGSTNGTYVNGKRIKMHTLRDGDAITIGRHRLVMKADTPAGQAGADRAASLQATTIISPETLGEVLAAGTPQAEQSPAGSAPRAAPGGGPFLQVVAGPSAGQHIAVTDPITELAAGVRLEGDSSGRKLRYVPDAKGTARAVRINGRKVTAEPVRVKDMDMVQIDDTWMAYHEG